MIERVSCPTTDCVIWSIVTVMRGESLVEGDWRLSLFEQSTVDFISVSLSL
jgi:hypothetical protein